MTTPLPSLFVSHGAPDLPLRDCPARGFLRQLGHCLPTPKAILVISPHWMTSIPTLTTAPHLRAIHDFSGFPKALSALRYEPTGAVAVAQQAAALIEQQGLPVAFDPNRGLDHGAWVPLLLMYPAAQIPVVQLSLPTHWTAAELLKLGDAMAEGRSETIAPLRRQGVLILASGSATHNLGAWGQALDASPPDWVQVFDRWLTGALEQGDLEQLLAYADAPFFNENHPTPEHLLPLFIALGATDAGRPGQHLHGSYTYGILSMAAFAFGAEVRVKESAAELCRMT